MRRCIPPALLLALLAAPLQAGEGKARSDYILRCAGCHGMTGEGTVEGGVPAFPGSVGAIAGLDEGRTYMMHVPGVVGASLGNAQIAEVMNYILGEWSDGSSTPFTEEEVARRRAIPVADVVTLRRAVVATLEAEGIYIADYPWP
ncbi:cytochrome C [Mangrovicoccus sp. HB161399]|uniref:c-type cytochrome n=1 Tax=Mangrovicoccus sp. HB161399 TaxID=2720392 RepID=UPI001556F93E|nr:cytochrome C [Mangrovicoccus sp. HB161399]